MVGLGMVEEGGFLMNKSCQELSILYKNGVFICFEG
jgi:hypothetical protein